MKGHEINLDDAVAVLEQTPASLAALLKGLPDTWIRATEGDGTWSPYNVIGHLIESEHSNWITRVRHILAGETEAFEPFDRTIPSEDQLGNSLDELLVVFADRRRESLAALREMNLTDDDLVRRGLHPDLGEVTLGQLLATWVVHDLDHIAQVTRTMAKTYSDATGPWSVYLSILRDRK